MAAYTGDPQTYDLPLVIGDTFGPHVVEFQGDNGAIVDITGATGECEVRDSIGGTLLLSPVVTVNGSGGSFTFTAAPNLTEPLAEQRAKYSVRLTFLDGTVKTVLEGDVDIRPSVVE